jgi:serine/threonine protein kinase
MGEVYRAVDTRLDREVALKVLPRDMADQPDRVQRFEREARAVGSLNHPNVMAIYDVGRWGETSYLVTELLEGRTLATLMRESTPSPRRTVDLALQIAKGLGAVHAKGLVHRDLKPDNVFVTRDGRVKLLDFGLAKAIPVVDPGLLDGNAPTLPGRPVELTEAGMVLGTVAYMSPEQVRGLPADARSDIFSFGALLFEVLSGRRPFEGPSLIETMNAILKEEPPPLVVPKGELPPALERLVLHCLEKDPANRFQSAQDLAFDLESLTLEGSGPARLLLKAAPGLPKWLWTLGAAALLATILGSGFVAGRRSASPLSPQLQRLTYRRGNPLAARFADEGKSVVYSAAWNGEPTQIYSLRPGSPESRDLGLEKTTLLSLSSKGEMAILTKLHQQGWTTWGTLARVPLSGGAPRELIENVSGADWDPEGKDLAVIRYQEGLFRLEYPPGKPRASTGGWFSDVRFHPQGKQISLVEHPIRGDDRGRVLQVSLEQGESHPLTAEFSSLQGLAWSPDGREVWFSGAAAGTERGLWAVASGGKVRSLLQIPGGAFLLDVNPNGEALLAHTQHRMGIMFQRAGESPREMGWLSWSLLHGLSADGKWIIFDEEADREGPDYGIYLRATNGEAAVHLGDGSIPALSPDQKWVLVGRHRPEPSLALLPTGPGTARQLPLQGLESFHRIVWHPDGKRFLLFASEKGQRPKLYLQSLGDKQLNPILDLKHELEAEGMVSPDGRWVSLRGNKGAPLLLDLEHPKDPPRSVAGLLEKEFIAQWTQDSEWVFVTKRGLLPQPMVRLRLRDGKREPFGELGPSGSARGTTGSVHVTPDGRTLAFSFNEFNGDLYRVTGLR